jgi:hypothetical protein
VKVPVPEKAPAPQFVRPVDLNEAEPVVQQARDDLTKDRALLSSVLSRREFRWIDDPQVGRMFFGTAVQRVTTLRLALNPIRNQLYISPSEYLGPGPGYLRFRGNQPGPDLIGIDSISGQPFEITTYRDVDPHSQRPDYKVVHPTYLKY